MAKQTYPDMLVPNGTKTSLTELIESTGISSSLSGIARFEVQNVTTNGTIYVFFGNQTKLSGVSSSPLPAFWTREEEEDPNNIYFSSRNEDTYLGLVVYE